MTAVTDPQPGLAAPGTPRADVRGHVPGWVHRVPNWLWVSLGLGVLMVLSALVRTYYLSGQLWMDEAITTGIAQHPLHEIPGILRVDGNPPLYYLLLHFWVRWFGDSAAAGHSLSVLFAVLTVPAGWWAGTKLFGTRAGWFAAILFAFNAWLTSYAQETRMYELMGLLGIVATGSLVLGFVYRQRRYLWLFGPTLTAMLYTHTWGTFFFAGSLIALLPAFFASPERKRFFLDALITYGIAFLLWVPWIPTFLFQVAHTAAPWSTSPRFGAPIQISRDLLGGDRITLALGFVAVIGLAPLVTKRYRRSREAITLWTLIALPIAVLVLAWIASQVNPAWNSRYFMPILGSILLLLAWGCSRARMLGFVGIILALIYLHNPATFAPQNKSNMREVSAEMAPYLHRGDLVIVGQSEQTPLAWYYLPAGLRFANTDTGRVLADPSYMNWVDSLKKIKHTAAAPAASRLVASLHPGQQVLFVRPLTEGTAGWNAPWTEYARRRSAQWTAVLQSDVHRGILRAVQYAPHEYQGSCCVADSAVLYRRVR